MLRQSKVQSISPLGLPVTPLVRGRGAAWEVQKLLCTSSSRVVSEGVPPFGDSWELGFHEVRPGVEVGGGRSKDSWAAWGGVQLSGRQDDRGGV